MKNQIIFSSFDSIGNPNYNGGGAIAIHNIAKQLANIWNITVVAGKFNGSRNQKIDKVNYVYIGSKSFPLFDQAYFHLATFIYSLTHKFDIWFESFTPPCVVGFIPLFTKRPVIGLGHMLPGVDMTRKYKLPFGLIEKYALRSYDYLIAVSDYFGDKLKKDYPRSRVIIIKNGIDKVKRVSQSGEHILFLGRIEIGQKGLDLLLSAYKLISHKTKHNLIIAGSGPKRELQALKSLINEYNLQERVQLVGRVDQQKKKDLLARAAVTVVPSRFETFSLVASEALAAGSPLVTLDIGGLSWIPSTARFVAENISSNALANSLKSALFNQEEIKKKREEGIKLVSQLTWEKSASFYAKLIKELTHE